MRTCILVLTSLFLLVPADAAQQSGRGGPGGPGGQGRQPGGRRSVEEVDWAKVMQFFQDHSPNRYASFMTLTEEEQRRVRGDMLYRYRNIEWLKRDNQDRLVEIKQDELRYEDALFRNKLDILRKGVDSPDVEPIKQQFVRNIHKLVELRLEERDLRLKRLKELATIEEEKLQKDRDQIETLVQQRVEAELRSESFEDRGYRDDDRDRRSGPPH